MEGGRMKEYKINRRQVSGEDYETMIISERDTGRQLSEDRLTHGQERKEIAQMRRAINQHLADGGGLGNYQW